MSADLYLWLFFTALFGIFMVIKGIPILIFIAERKHLFDDDREERKVHEGFIPNIGGIMLVIAFVFVLSLHPLSAEIAGFNYLIAAVIVLFAVGVKDDLMLISPWKKLLGQFLAAAFMILGAGLTIPGFGGLFGVTGLPLFLSVPFTFMVFIVTINAVNLIDGIDGLAASFTASASLLFALFFYTAALYPLFVFSLLLAVIYGSFLWFNWQPARIFMGDTGSLLSGFFLAFLSVSFLDATLSESATTLWQQGAPVFLVAIMLLPLYDTLRVFVIRLLQGRSPFSADTNHIHHEFLREGFSHGVATASLMGIHLLILGSLFLSAPYLSLHALFGLLILLTLLLLPTYSLKRSFLNLFLKWTGFENTYSFNGSGSKEEEPPSGSESHQQMRDPETNVELQLKEYEQNELEPQERS